MSAAPTGTLVIVSGPSGVGKTTIVARLIERAGLARSISATTRLPRPGEVHGVNYFFMTDAEFHRGIAAGEFIEHAEIYGRLYGTPKNLLLHRMGQGTNVVLDIDPQGARAFRGMTFPLFSVFVLPPSMEELRRRLEGRASDRPEEAGRRLRQAEAEMREKDAYDLQVVNRDLDRAVEEILAALRARGIGGTP